MLRCASARDFIAASLALSARKSWLLRRVRKAWRESPQPVSSHPPYPLRPCHMAFHPHELLCHSPESAVAPAVRCAPEPTPATCKTALGQLYDIRKNPDASCKSALCRRDHAESLLVKNTEPDRQSPLPPSRRSDYLRLLLPPASSACPPAPQAYSSLPATMQYAPAVSAARPLEYLDTHPPPRSAKFHALALFRFCVRRKS